MRQIFFLVFSLFLVLPVSAQRYPFDKNDVDAFVIDEVEEDDDFFNSENTQQNSSENSSEEEATPSQNNSGQSESSSDSQNNDTEQDSNTQTSSSSGSTNDAETDTSGPLQNQEDQSDNSATEVSGNTNQSAETNLGNDNNNQQTEEEASQSNQQTNPQDLVDEGAGSAESNLSNLGTTQDNASNSNSDINSNQAGSPVNENVGTNEEDEETNNNQEDATVTEEEKISLIETLKNLVIRSNKSDTSSNVLEDEGDANTIVTVRVNAEAATAIQTSQLAEAPLTPEEVDSEETLNQFVGLTLFSDGNIENVSLTEKNIRTSYTQPAKLFGFIPIRYRQDVLLKFSTTTTLDSVTIRKPWWTLLTSGDNTSRLELEIKKQVEEVLLEQGTISEEELAGLFKRLALIFSRLIQMLQDFGTGLLR